MSWRATLGLSPTPEFKELKELSTPSPQIIPEIPYFLESSNHSSSKEPSSDSLQTYAKKSADYDFTEIPDEFVPTLQEMADALGDDWPHVAADARLLGAYIQEEVERRMRLADISTKNNVIHSDG